MQYVSTRGGVPPQDFKTILLQGLAKDGGLFMPQSFPTLAPLSNTATYAQTVTHTLAPYVGAGFDLNTACTDSYAHFQPVLKQLDKNLYVLELFHGPTLAFKDFALQLLGRLLPQATNTPITILGATSGDTGSAAMHGCVGMQNGRIFILYPNGKPSDIQRRQMTTLGQDHVHAIAVDGSFDDCQNLVKQAFNTPELNAQHNFIAINSINWARIIAQSAYYIWACAQLPNAQPQFVVPTGNFGNIFAGLVAQKMGASLGALHAATNANDALVHIINHQSMRTSHSVTTLTPSMDIQVPSNFERYLYLACGCDAARVADIMQIFKTTGQATLPTMGSTITASKHDDAQTLTTIKTVYDKYGYVCDPHTAVGLSAAMQRAQQTDQPVIALGCAHPAKFPETVKRALGFAPTLPDHLQPMLSARETFTVVPNNFAALVDVLSKR